MVRDLHKETLSFFESFLEDFIGPYAITDVLLAAQDIDDVLGVCVEIEIAEGLEITQDWSYDDDAELRCLDFTEGHCRKIIDKLRREDIEADSLLIAQHLSYQGFVRPSEVVR